MKISRYNINSSIDDKIMIIYNTLSRKYVVYEKENHEKIWNMLNNLNKDNYETDEINIIKKLLNKGIIHKDNVDELSIIEFNENKAKYHDEYFNLMIIPTLGCNFRCSYCYEEHVNLSMDDKTEEKIIAFVNKITKKVNRLKVSWFGGEPLLQITRIMSLSKQLKEICEKNSCILEAQMTTNGYLLTDEIIDKCKEFNINSLQITLDGVEEAHNKRRPLANGEGTFKKIFENILKLVKNDIHVMLRCNVEQENFDYITELFESIPQEYRHLVNITISNLFQAEKNLNLYELYKSSIEKGYDYSFKKNNYAVCEVCYKNGFTIAPDGKVITCTVAKEHENEYSLGELTEEGEFILKNPGLFYKLKTTSALKNKECLDCIKLPMCIGTCKLKRLRNNNECTGEWGDGLEIKDRALLHYYSDLKRNIIKQEDII